MSDLSIIDWLLSSGNSIDTKEIPSLALWKHLFFQLTSNVQNTADMAIAGGFISDRPAYAFSAGYWSALYCLIPSLPGKTITAMCVTEKDGNHPKAIKSELSSKNQNGETIWLINGSKKFVTGANEAEVLLIAASAGTSESGQNKIRLIRVNNHIPGITIKPLKDLPFIPEISHGELEINNVQITESQILPGDGYANYIKPFRTLEDIHVTAAILGYLLRIAFLFNWPQSTKEQVLALLTGIKTIALSNPLQSVVHIILSGVSGMFSSFLNSIDLYWKLTDDKTRSQWERDKALLNIAGNAREKRLSTAWSQYES